MSDETINDPALPKPWNNPDLYAIFMDYMKYYDTEELVTTIPEGEYVNFDIPVKFKNIFDNFIKEYKNSGAFNFLSPDSKKKFNISYITIISLSFFLLLFNLDLISFEEFSLFSFSLGFSDLTEGLFTSSLVFF